MPSLLETQSAPSRTRNLILAALSKADYDQLAPLLHAHPLRMRETLLEAGDEPDYIYFPLNGVISVLTVLENGMMIEFATVGPEGTTGVPLFLGFGESNTALISQVPGDALRLSSKDFTDCIARLPSFAAVMLRYSGLMLALVSQSAACNRAHHADARCARWLLMTHDQVGADEFPITQEFLAQMLGVSRPSVALSAGALQRAGLVSYHRGEMRILDRRALELAACECYAVVRTHFAHFTESPVEPPRPKVHHVDAPMGTSDAAAS
ncbi:MAG: Crp/Fnr family transcriptional regulator [Anaerolinea sp.]|nr:Crp/Fnr family transcriptional regulator [Anaerolinea sp.]